MKPLTLQSAHDKQSETIQKQAHKIAMLVKQVEANGECHKGLTAKPCHCEAIESAYDKLKERIEGAPKVHAKKALLPPYAIFYSADAIISIVELTPEEMEKNDE